MAIAGSIYFVARYLNELFTYSWIGSVMSQRSSLLPVQSADVNKSLALSGLLDKLTDTENKIIQYKDLILYLETAIREVESAASDEATYSRLVVGFQAVEIICKVAVETILFAEKASLSVVTELSLEASSIVAESINDGLLHSGEGYL